MRFTVAWDAPTEARSCLSAGDRAALLFWGRLMLKLAPVISGHFGGAAVAAAATESNKCHSPTLSALLSGLRCQHLMVFVGDGRPSFQAG